MPMHLHLIQSGSDLSLSSARYSIGRAKDNDIIVSDSAVSTHHALIVIVSNVITLHDLNSRNGTFVNDNYVQGATKLTVGDTIKLGEVSFAILKEIQQDEPVNQSVENKDVKSSIKKEAHLEDEQVSPEQKQSILEYISQTLKETNRVLRPAVMAVLLDLFVFVICYLMMFGGLILMSGGAALQGRYDLIIRSFIIMAILTVVGMVVGGIYDCMICGLREQYIWVCWILVFFYTIITLVVLRTDTAKIANVTELSQTTINVLRSYRIVINIICIVVHVYCIIRYAFARANGSLKPADRFPSVASQEHLEPLLISYLKDLYYVVAAQFTYRTLIFSLVAILIAGAVIFFGLSTINEMEKNVIGSLPNPYDKPVGTAELENHSDNSRIRNNMTRLLKLVPGQQILKDSILRIRPYGKTRIGNGIYIIELKEIPYTIFIKGKYRSYQIRPVSNNHLMLRTEVSMNTISSVSQTKYFWIEQPYEIVDESRRNIVFRYNP